MRRATPILASFFALTTLPMLAQQTMPSTAPGQPAAQQTTPAEPGGQSAPARATPGTAPETQAPPTSQAATAPAGPMQKVNGELVSKLDSKTAKQGDSVEIKTKSAIKTPDGKEIPKGSKLVGKVVMVKPSESGATSQLVLQFDHVEVKGGQNMAVKSEIESIGPAEGSASSDSGSMAASPAPAGGGAAPAGGSASASNSRSTTQQQPSSGSAAEAGSGAPAAGTVVAKNGNIAIQTTSVPGVLLANNAPGTQDPRLANASSILLGNKQDVKLDGGTPVVVGVAAAGQ